MAKRKPKPDPDTTEPAVDPLVAEAAAHARADAVTDPAAFEFPLPPAAEATLPDATPGDHPLRSAELGHQSEKAAPTPTVATEAGRAADGGEKAWKPLFGLRADHEAGVGLLEDRRFKQMQIRFAEKPSDAVREAVREAGYQWRSQDQAWTKQLDPDAAWRTRAEATALFDRVAGMVRDEKGLGRELG